MGSHSEKTVGDSDIFASYHGAGVESGVNRDWSGDRGERKKINWQQPAVPGGTAAFCDLSLAGRGW